MITVIGAQQEIDYVVEQLACGSCEECPGRVECDTRRKSAREPGEGESCGEVIRRHIITVREEKGECRR